MVIFVVIFGFHASFLCKFGFLFCFLIEVEFLAYLRLCKCNNPDFPRPFSRYIGNFQVIFFYSKPSKNKDWRIVILEKNKTCELGVLIYNPFYLLKFMCSFFLYYFLYLPPVILEELWGVRKNILIQSRQDSIILMIQKYIYYNIHNGYMIVMYQVNML